MGAPEETYAIIYDYLNHLKKWLPSKEEMCQYLLMKLQEELGEYAEIAIMRDFSPQRKLTKYNISNEQELRDFTQEKITQEAGDLLWLAMSIAILEGHTPSSIEDYWTTRIDDSRTKVGKINEM